MKSSCCLALLFILLAACSPATPAGDLVQTAVAQTVAAQQPVQQIQVSPVVSIPTDTMVPTPIIVPSNTPKPTKLPTSTKIPSSPTPSVPPLEILSSQSYVDSGWYHIVGEVKNNTDNPMEFVKIIATLYDDNNKITGTDFTYTELDVIPPGGKSPFETGTEEFAGTTNYKLQVQGNPGTLGRQDLVISNDSSYIDYGWLHIRGEVQNTGTTPAEYVKVIVTLYDANGNVVGMDFAYTELDSIPAGGSSPFETGTEHYPDFDHYILQVQGR